MTRREYILSQWDCLTFARDVLHMRVSSSGRAKSLDGQDRAGNEALSLTKDVWYDHKKNVGGTVIDLCAWAMFDGDIGRAMNYLAGDFYDVNAAEWRENVERISRDAVQWHEKLLPDDREYLHSRRITDETIERLKLGSMTMDSKGRPKRRLVIPYFRNGHIVYYVSRDRSGIEGEPKYQKCYLPKDKDGRDKEVLQNIPWGLHTLGRASAVYQVTLSNYGIKKHEWLVIAEGAFDAMSFEQEGYCVLATMGGHFAPSVMKEVTGHAKNFANVLVIFDNDTAGVKFLHEMSRHLFSHRVNFFAGHVPERFSGQVIKDVSDYYTLGGELGELIRTAEPGLEALAGTLEEAKDCQDFLYRSARFAAKSDVIQLYQSIKARKLFNPLWLKTVFDEAVKSPAETVIVREVMAEHDMKYVEGSGFFEYMHGVWLPLSDNAVKGYADEKLGRHATNSKMTSAMKFLQARLSCTDPMNSQPVINLQNGILLPDEQCKFVMHSPSYLSTIQIPYMYDRDAGCDLWRAFIRDITEGDVEKAKLLQEIGGYVMWPDNGLEKCFFLIGDGGNGKGVFMDTLRDVYGRDNCSALPLSSFGSQFDSIMLQYSLVNFASENRVDLRGNIERIKEVTSGNDIVAAHKGVDAVKFSPRCKLITSCNDFFNTGDITHALMRRMCFVKFTRNIVQQKKADIFLKDKLRAELPGILNWCIQGYLRLRKNRRFTETEEDHQQKLEFMRTTNPVAFFIEERLLDRWNDMRDTRELYREFKTWSEDAGYKALSLGAFTNRIKRVMREMRPEVGSKEIRHHTYLIFPAMPDTKEE